MARPKSASLAILRAAASDGVTTCTRLRDLGVSASAIATRCRPGGPWRRLLPGIILLSSGEPTRRQQMRAAVYYTSPGSVVSGVDALRARGVPLMPSRDIQMLVTPGRRTLPRDFFTIERTSRVPAPELDDGLPLAPPARAAIDAARRETDADRLRQLLTLPIYHGLCTAHDLHVELESGNQRGSAAVREMLRRVDSTGETYRHRLAREVLAAVPLPPPAWNVTICDLQDREIGRADAWWDEVALGWQFETARTAKSTAAINPLALTAAGVIIVRTDPERLRDSDRNIARELTSAFASAAKRRRPNILAYSNIAPFATRHRPISHRNLTA
ncbi:hypothetical protein [Amycolatopsis pigmentata]|uniref:Transcriptional regulator, AbiEi antitoxin, Type IV TA system n=1 Tax=Amycolatopsis pigmentata TaxID=450801 RepID=A0ABW5G0K3_9PSEU